MSDQEVESRLDRLLALVRTVPDFPSPGIAFKDITPLLADGAGLDLAVVAMADPWRDDEIDLVVGIEARGFLLGTPVARELGAGFVPVRKEGKLPSETAAVSYGLEYGADTIEMHIDAVTADHRVVIIDDVLATGGTAAAARELVTATGASLAGFGFLIELAFLNGRSRIDGQRVETIMVDEG